MPSGSRYARIIGKVILARDALLKIIFEKKYCKSIYCERRLKNRNNFFGWFVCPIYICSPLKISAVCYASGTIAATNI